MGIFKKIIKKYLFLKNLKNFVDFKGIILYNHKNRFTILSQSMGATMSSSNKPTKNKSYDILNTTEF